MILIADDDPRIVDGLRREGLRAWAISPFASVSRWMFQGIVHKAPIRTESVHVVGIMDPLVHVDDLLEMMRILAPLGFLAVDIRYSPSAHRTLERAGYEKLPFTWRDHSLYRKAA